MPSGIYPEVTFPRIGVVAKAPGLDLTTMDLKVTRPLEEAVSSVIGVSEVRSKTIRRQRIVITCTPAPTCTGPNNSSGTTSVPSTANCREPGTDR